ncbi:MAG TPA: SprT family zinc-dependent metalloprotease [Gaiellaceae bacterium]|nr:SprT family zinc-dependent metalloprotease [Gaiellaceae bacterium]
MEYELRVSARARYLRVEVPFGGPPLVVVPRGVARARADAFLAEKRPWIERQLARQVRRLELPPIAEPEGRRRARAAVTEVAEREAARLGLSVGRIRIADQRSRWGSCSARGTLSFNWRLALAPFEVLDYVVVHELCHLREPNHSRRFWALVESARPGWRAQRAWLREHGPELQAYRPA